MTTRDHSLSALNAHLFDQLNRLSAPGLTPDQLEAELKRAEAIVSVGDGITRSADLQLTAAKLFAEHGQSVLPHLPRVAPPRERDAD
jgi:hypothetical protein